LADVSFSDDRRRAVNAGLWQGRDVVISELRRTTELGVEISTSEFLATRGRRLVLSDVRWSPNDQGPEAFHSEALFITEIGTDQRIVAFIVFEHDDIDAAFAELDARYLAGEAAAYARTWTAITQACAALTRGEMPSTTAALADVDHRRFGAIGSGDLMAYLRASLDDSVETIIRILAVHRLNRHGAVVTHYATGTTRKDFDAEWRLLDVFTVEGDLISRCELFDEADLEGALARFDELHQQTKRLENAASQAVERFWSYLATGGWDAMAELLTDDVYFDDRRRVVNAGILRGRDVQIANMRAVAEVGFEEVASTVVATRGQRLALMRLRVSIAGQADESFVTEALFIGEINGGGKFVAALAFDPADIEAAFAELEARYLVGEAAPHSDTWTTMMQFQAAYNQHQVPLATEDCVTVDHRQGRAFAPGDLIPFVVATWTMIPDHRGCLEAVHRLNDFGAVITAVMSGTSRDGFDAEWREVALFAFEGNRLSRFEVFDESDLDAALARFDELEP